MQVRYIQLKDKQIHYTIEGNGKAVVLLHGFMEAVFIWKKLSKVLSSTYKVICIDLAGHGKTQYFKEFHTMDLQADIVKAVIDAEKEEKISIIGHSMGGYVCMAFAHNYPEKVEALGLFHSNASADDEVAIVNRNRTIGLLRSNKADFIVRFMPELFADDNVDKFDKEIQLLQEYGRQMDVEAIIASIVGLRERPSYLRTYALDIPFMFIIGKRDNKSNFQKVLAQTIMPKQSHILLLDCGHMGFYEEEEVCTKFIKGFLAE